MYRLVRLSPAAAALLLVSITSTPPAGASDGSVTTTTPLAPTSNDAGNDTVNIGRATTLNCTVVVRTSAPLEACTAIG